MEHFPGPAGQIWYPGGKDGLWLSNCAAGDYTALDVTPAKARKRVQEHADAKNRALIESK